MKIGRGETDHLYLDVDGTLLFWPAPGRPGAPTEEQRRNAAAAARGWGHDPALLPKLNEKLIDNAKEWHRKSGGVLVIWSMGGTSHASVARMLCGFGIDRVVCIGKPDLAVDDNAAVWGKGAPLVVAPDAFELPR